MADSADVQAQYMASLLARVAAGDREAFAAIYRTTAPRLFSLAIRMLRNKDLAEEILQEIFVTVWTKAPGFDPAKGAAINWLISVARNKCLDRLRARRPESSLDESVVGGLPDTAPGPLDAALSSSEARALKACLDRLGEGPRDAILRVYYEGLTHAELAQRTATPLGTLKSWIRRGLLQLKDCLDR